MYKKLLFCLNINLLLFCRSRCRRRRPRCRGCLKLLIDPARRSQLKVKPPPPGYFFLTEIFFSVLALRSRVNGVLEHLKRIKNGP